MTLGAIDDLRTSAHALAVSYPSAGSAGRDRRGGRRLRRATADDHRDDHRPPAGCRPSPSRSRRLHDGPGRRRGRRWPRSTGRGRSAGRSAPWRTPWPGTVADLTPWPAAAEIAMPGLSPRRSGPTEPKRYLVCALNDAELFGSGGAPLSAMVVQADRGPISVPISGQLESKLSPQQPPDRLGARRRPALVPGGQALPVRQLQLPPRLPHRLGGHAVGRGPPWATRRSTASSPST